MKHMETERFYTNVITRLRKANLHPSRQRITLAKMLFEGANRYIKVKILHQESLNLNVRITLAIVYYFLNQFTSAELLRETGVNS